MLFQLASLWPMRPSTASSTLRMAVGGALRLRTCNAAVHHDLVQTSRCRCCRFDRSQPSGTTNRRARPGATSSAGGAVSPRRASLRCSALRPLTALRACSMSGCTSCSSASTAPCAHTPLDVLKTLKVRSQQLSAWLREWCTGSRRWTSGLCLCNGLTTKVLRDDKLECAQWARSSAARCQAGQESQYRFQLRIKADDSGHHALHPGTTSSHPTRHQ
jgi:hypothetical protein